MGAAAQQAQLLLLLLPGEREGTPPPSDGQEGAPAPLALARPQRKEGRGLSRKRREREGGAAAPGKAGGAGSFFLARLGDGDGGLAGSAAAGEAPGLRLGGCRAFPADGAAPGQARPPPSSSSSSSSPSVAEPPDLGRLLQEPGGPRPGGEGGPAGELRGSAPAPRRRPPQGMALPRHQSPGGRAGGGREGRGGRLRPQVHPGHLPRLPGRPSGPEAPRQRLGHLRRLPPAPAALQALLPHRLHRGAALLPLQVPRQDGSADRAREGGLQVPLAQAGLPGVPGEGCALPAPLGLVLLERAGRGAGGQAPGSLFWWRRT